jgi:molecular chaperone DnaK
MLWPMGYQLGVDLGTTYAAAALYRDGRVELVPLGDRSTVVPSVAFIGSDGTVLVGEAANRRGVLEPERVAREFKRRMGDPTPMVVGGAPYPADALVAHLLRAVVSEVSEREGAGPDGLALTHPANWGAYKLDFLRQAVGHAGLGEIPVTYLSEPEAAALHYAAAERVPIGAAVAVYDLGGGTFDAAVLRRRDEHGFEVMGRPEGIERLGGVDFDAGVLAHVDRALDGAVSGLDEDDEAAVQAVARLRAECVEAKEVLSRDVDVAIPVVLPHRATTVRLTRAEFEAMIRPALGETITALRGALRSAGVSADEVHAVLLVGGSSRIPLVAQMVSAELGRPIVVDAHPKHAVAQGAAAAAAARAGAGGPDAVTIVQASEVPAPPVLTAPPSPTLAAGLASPDITPPGSGTSSGQDMPTPSWAPPAATGSDLPPPATDAGVAHSSPRRWSPAQAVLALAAAVAVVVAAVIAVTVAQGDDGGGGEGGEPTEEATPVAELEPLAENVPPVRRADVPSPAEPAVPPARQPRVLATTGTPPTATNADVQAYIDACADRVDDCDRLYDAAEDDAERAYARTCGNRLPEEDASGDCIVAFDAIPTSTNAELQAAVVGCADGAVDDCDRLYDDADDTPLRTYARTCGHRLDDTDATGDCTIRYSAVPTSSDAEVQGYIDSCTAGAIDDCDRLYDAASGGPPQDYARTCGHRLREDEASGDCTARFNVVPSSSDAEVQGYIDSCAAGAIDDCDRLYDAASGGPPQDYARTCGHRIDAPDASGDCTVRFRYVPSSPDAEVQDYIDGCSSDEIRDCDRLYDAAGGGPSQLYARTCGHRLDQPDASGDCATRG